MSAGAKILLIEDDRGIADTLSRVLADEEGRVKWPSNGGAMKGLARAGRETFNLRVITDLRLPGLSGPGVSAAIAHGPTAPAHHSDHGLWHHRDGDREATKFGMLTIICLKPFDMPRLRSNWCVKRRRATA